MTTIEQPTTPAAPPPPTFRPAAAPTTRRATTQQAKATAPVLATAGLALVLVELLAWAAGWIWFAAFNAALLAGAGAVVAVRRGRWRVGGRSGSPFGRSPRAGSSGRLFGGGGGGRGSGLGKLFGGRSRAGGAGTGAGTTGSGRKPAGGPLARLRSKFGGGAPTGAGRGSARGPMSFGRVGSPAGRKTPRTAGGRGSNAGAGAGGRRPTSSGQGKAGARWWPGRRKKEAAPTKTTPGKATTPPVKAAPAPAKATPPAKTAPKPAAAPVAPPETKPAATTQTPPAPIPVPTPRHAAESAPTTKGTTMSNPLRYRDDASLQGWGRDLDKVAPAVDELAGHSKQLEENVEATVGVLNALVAQGSDDLPASPEVVAQVEDIKRRLADIQALDVAAQLRQIAREAETLRTSYQRHHETDEGRLHGERGTRSQERRADVGRAEQDT